MEYAIFKLQNSRDLKEEFKALDRFRSGFAGEVKIGRIYWGSEYCSNLLPSVSKLQRIRAELKKRRCSLTLVTPAMISDHEVARLRRLFSYLNRFQAEKVEVVVNDWGVLELIREYRNLRPLLGRLLNKSERDPRINYQRVRPVKRAILQSSSMTGQPVVAFLKNKGVRAIEYENTPQVVKPAKITGGLKQHLYYPQVLMSLDRHCFFAKIANRGDFGPDFINCGSDCKKFIIKRNFAGGRAKSPFEVCQVGKGIYFKNEQLPRNFNAFQRLVITLL
jgi:hypothetical protein